MQTSSSQSAVKRHSRKTNLRAAGAVLVFLLSWLAPSVSLLAQPLDYCSMECCVAKGHCCCASQKLWVEGQDHSDTRELWQTEIKSSCPYPVTPPTSAKVFSRQMPQSIWHEQTTNQPPLIGHQRGSGYDSLRYSPKTPRAPPASFLHA